MPLAPVGGELQRKTMFLFTGLGFCTILSSKLVFQLLEGNYFSLLLVTLFLPNGIAGFKNEDHLTLLQLELIPAPL